MTDLADYRPNVGLVLFNATGQVWLGRRAGTPPPYNWQFPQGGVDEGEDLDVAALRELEEETGISSVRILDRTPGWLSYDYPPLVSSKLKKGWKGQKQVWFAMLFEGTDDEINLAGHHTVEFDAWRWGQLSEAPALIIPFKQPVYEAVVAAFAPLASRLPKA